MSQTGYHTIAIDISPDISKSKGNQTMKFGQLVENNIRKIFLKNYEQNEVDKLVPDSFIKDQN